MTQTFKNIGTALAVFALFDLFILAMSLSQIAVEGRTGYWSPFWRVQAEAVIRLLN